MREDMGNDGCLQAVARKQPARHQAKDRIAHQDKRYHRHGQHPGQRLRSGQMPHSKQYGAEQHRSSHQPLAGLPVPALGCGTGPAALGGWTWPGGRVKAWPDTPMAEERPW